ncbi:hypothetical protein PFICI_09950 [Pestalotiopsis fici W106-1]|uniref:Uncharacterized protein n=1 Tax=Pestalotiopsis fici (strain W106-1 / CGMCC3.15140) TaxID=1229662 RepID=W3WVI8_PESFW|nr:uncharacterized protein PFICI_09950 [Pestalotiopsis fici W106-1]ETS77888.1 hypothetical protein PFICI_09950 [Pestalotiopsis fici W106-1]
MSPLIPRLHLFEIDDQSWFHPYLRARVQDGLMHAWTFSLPFLWSSSPATLVASILQRTLGSLVSQYTFIDFCAGAGGPTPFIEKALNASLSRASSSSVLPPPSTTDAASRVTPSYADMAGRDSNGSANAGQGEGSDSRAVDFVLTDLHPHPSSWAQIAAASKHVTYVPFPVDASDAPEGLIQKYKARGRRVFRLFNLAFHHFDDPLARAILKNTVETSDGFGIFEMQDRSFGSLVTCFMYGFFIMLCAPFFYWWSPIRLFFVYAMPIVPFVLVFDGIVSSLRTRTPEEVEILLRTCGADTSEWEIKSGRERFLWPTGYLNWIVCTKKSS